jgi:hypothetical protein
MLPDGDLARKTEEQEQARLQGVRARLGKDDVSGEHGGAPREGARACGAPAEPCPQAQELYSLPSPGVPSPPPFSNTLFKHRFQTPFQTPPGRGRRRGDVGAEGAPGDARPPGGADLHPQPAALRHPQARHQGAAPPLAHPGRLATLLAGRRLSRTRLRPPYLAPHCSTPPPLITQSAQPNPSPRCPPRCPRSTPRAPPCWPTSCSQTTCCTSRRRSTCAPCPPSCCRSCPSSAAASPRCGRRARAGLGGPPGARPCGSDFRRHPLNLWASVKPAGGAAETSVDPASPKRPLPPSPPAPQMGTTKESFVELTERIGRKTGGISVYPFTRCAPSGRAFRAGGTMKSQCLRSLPCPALPLTHSPPPSPPPRPAAPSAASPSPSPTSCCVARRWATRRATWWSS